MPLSMAMDYISEVTGVPIRLDTHELAEEAVTEDDEISCLPGGRPLKESFHLMLDDVVGAHLTYIVRDGAIVITTAVAASEVDATNIYHVADILDAMPPAHGGPDYMSLIDIIQALTSNEWVAPDRDFSSICDPLPGGRLAILATQKTHEEIAVIIDHLRKGIDGPFEPEPFDPDVVETRYYQFESPTAEDFLMHLPTLIAPETWRSEEHPESPGIIHAFAVQESDRNRFRGGGFFQSPPERAADETNADNDDEAPVEVEVPTYTWLVITQSAGVHQRIATWFEELQLGIPGSTSRPFPSAHELDTTGILSGVTGR